MRPFTLKPDQRKEERRGGPRDEPRRCRVESLEQRQVLSTMLGFDNQGLAITADPAWGSTVKVSQHFVLNDALRQERWLKIQMSGPSEPLRVVWQPAWTLNHIRFLGSKKSDYFDNSTSIPCQAFGRGGNDTLCGGWGGNTLDGGNGNDMLVGGAGNDSLIGGPGDDACWGLGGMNTLQGGDGNDRLYGGSAADILCGGAGDDKLAGGAGNDHYVFDLDSDLGSDTIDESFGGIDTLDFSASTTRGVRVDLSWAAAQVVAFTLKLTLGSATTIENVVGTSLPDTITGNSLANSLWGGGGNDTLQGGSGIDCLKGGEGDDRLEGGADNDNLHGGTGNDTLFGEAGDDLLYGEDGRDSLYGGDGTDWIHGGSGNDGLFGGIGCSDRLYGGPDADRFLEFEGEEVLVDCIAGTDAQIHFRDGAQITRSLFGENQTYAAGSWTDAEIIEVDGGLSYLHTTTGNTRLLRFGSTDGMTFVRQGSRTVGSRELAGGWNSGDGTQYFTAHGMAHVDVTVVHEAAHDWDDPAETQFATQFRQISDWTTTTAETHTQSGDGQWYWLSTTANTFARGYGRYNPFEDWATTWEAAYARDSRSNPLNLTLDSQKLAVIDAFFRSVS